MSTKIVTISQKTFVTIVFILHATKQENYKVQISDMIQDAYIGYPKLTVRKVRNECNLNTEQLVASVRRIL